MGDNLFWTLIMKRIQAAGAEIKRLREAKGLSHAALALRVKALAKKISERTIIRLEKSGATKLSTLLLIADALDCHVSKIIQHNIPPVDFDYSNSTSHTYDEQGNLVSTRSKSGVLTLTYDGHGSIINIEPST